MTIDIKSEALEDVVQLVVVGKTASVADLLKYSRAVADSCAAKACRRVLMDERALIMDEDALAAYEFSESDSIVELATSGIRIACLSSHENLKQNLAYETSMQNRSLNFRVFTDRGEALVWLRS